MVTGAATPTNVNGSDDMPQHHEDAKPIVAEITERALMLLAEHGEFDAETIERLRCLATTGSLRQKAQVISALTARRGKDHEDPQA